MTAVPGACATVCCWIRSVLFATDGTPFAEPYWEVEDQELVMLAVTLEEIRQAHW